MSKLMSRRGSKVSEFFIHVRHFTVCVTNKQLHVNTPHDCHMLTCIVAYKHNQWYMDVYEARKGIRKGKKGGEEELEINPRVSCLSCY